MGNLSLKQRLTENEVMFRQHNEKLQKELDNLVTEAEAEGYSQLTENLDEPLHFYCECANEVCKQRVVVRPSQYKKLHQNTSQFLILPGHNVAKIERVVKNTPNFVVVEKYLDPPKKVTTLHKTPKGPTGKLQV